MKKQTWLTVATLVLMGPLSSNPTGGQAISGDLTFHFHGKTLEIRAPDQSIVHWDDFSIDAGELTRFIQPSASATVLNKVLGLNPSLINGALEANGKVILINPQGVIVGKGGIIRTADFIASTLDRISSTAEGLEFSGDSTASIVNYGTIKTAFGDVVLIATTVNNSGSIEAPLGKVLIGAGSNVLLSPASEERIFIRPSLSSGSIENNGVLSATEVALKTEGSAYALAVNAGGLIHATDVIESDGKILLVAEGGLLTVNGTLESPKGTVELRGDQVFLDEAAHIDVSSNTGGGTVLIGTHHVKNSASNVYSDRVYVDPKAQIKADALVKGDGGTVIIWSETATQAYGAISGRGGPQGGDGGFVELSGRNYLVPKSLADLRAPEGKAGMLLIDPVNVNINAGPTDGGVNLAAIPTTLPNSPTTQIAGVDIANQLNIANVTIDTDQNIAPNPTADITVQPGGAISWNSPFTLTFNAHNDIQINDNIINAGTGNIIFTTDAGQGGSITVGNSGSIVPINVTTMGGNISMTGDKTVNIKAGSGGHLAGDVLVAGVNVAITANGSGNVFNLDSTTSGAWAEVHATGATLSINTPSTIGNINITADKGGFCHLLSQGNFAVAAGGDFLIPIADNATPGLRSVFIEYPSITGAASTFNATNFLITVQPGGLVQFDQQNSPTTITATNDFIFHSQGNPSILGVGDGLTTNGQALTMNIGRDLFLNADGGVGNVNGQAGVAILCNVTFNGTIGQDLLMLNTSNKGPNTLAANSNLTLTAGRDVFMKKSAGNILVNDVLMQSFAGNVDVRAGNNITLGDHSTVAVDSHHILMIAGRDMNITHASSLIDVVSPNGKGQVTLVVDNQAPISPNIGNGQFNFLAGLIQPSLAPDSTTPVLIYSAVRSQNTVNGTIRTQTFVPGPLGVNSPIEEWGIWFPAPILDVPVAPDFFKFYYKQVGSNPTPTPTPNPTPIPNIPFAKVAQIIGNMYDTIGTFQYDLPPYQDVFCMHVCDGQNKAELSRLKQSTWSRTWVDKEGRFFENDWCDFVKIDNFRKFYQNRQRVVPFYVGLQEEEDAKTAVTCP